MVLQNEHCWRIEDDADWQNNVLDCPYDETDGQARIPIRKIPECCPYAAEQVLTDAE